MVEIKLTKEEVENAFVFEGPGGVTEKLNRLIDDKIKASQKVFGQEFKQFDSKSAWAWTDSKYPNDSYEGYGVGVEKIVK